MPFRRRGRRGLEEAWTARAPVSQPVLLRKPRAVPVHTLDALEEALISADVGVAVVIGSFAPCRHVQPAVGICASS